MSKLISLRTPTPEHSAKPTGIPARPVIGDYLAYMKPKLTKGSLRVYRQRLFVFADYLETNHIGLDRITWKTVDAFLDHLLSTHQAKKPGASTMAQTTIRGYYVNLKSFLNWCLHDRITYAGVLDERIIRQISGPPLDKVIVRVFSDEQIRALLFWCAIEYNDFLVARDQTIIAVLTGCGLRCGELCSLKVGDCFLDDDSPHLIVFGKRHKERRVPIGPQTAQTLAHYIDTYRAEARLDDPVFTTRTRTKPLAVSGVEQLFDRIGLAAGITGVRCSPHTCRHYFASRFIKDGGSVYVLSKILGHQNLGTTEIYLRSLGVDWNMNDLVTGIMR